MTLIDSARAAQRTTVSGLTDAVHRNRVLSREGVRERLFTLAFRGLVYPQIWEDPVVDMEALQLTPTDRVMTIASGGCNALSYLTANPAEVVAVDLNGAHVALTKLKLAAASHLPDYATFRQFFAGAQSRDNVTFYDGLLRSRLDAATRDWWETRDLLGRRRITMFTRGFFRQGLLGRFVGAAHLLARAHGVNPKIMLGARTRDEQITLFEAHIAPMFTRPFMRRLLAQPASLYGLGIPPAQFRALTGGAENGAAGVVLERLRKLACNFDLRDNYFAAQAFGRSYGADPDAATPPYLEARHFDTIRERANRLKVVQISMTNLLREAPDNSFDAYVLLDAQDWMNDADLMDLWTEITRTARPGARVIFRTAANHRLLPGRVPARLLDAWTYNSARSEELDARDRSAIYGAFHLYTFTGGRA